MLADDVEALLVRVPDREHADPELNAPAECYLVPIDACYEFVGRLRMLWRGFDGGHEVREFVDEFFDRIKARSKVAGTVSDLTFTILDVTAEQFSVTPRLTARIGIAAGDDEPIQAIALRCQIRIEPLRRPVLRRGGRGPARPVRPAAALGQHPAHIPVAAQHRDGAGLHRRHRDLDAAGVHL